MSIVYPKNRNSQIMVLSNRSSDSFNMMDKYENDRNKIQGAENMLESQLLELLNLQNNYTQDQQEVVREAASEEVVAQGDYSCSQQNYLGDEDYCNFLRHHQAVEPENDYFSDYSDGIYRRFGRNGSNELDNSSPSSQTGASAAGYYSKLECFADLQDEGLENFNGIKI